MVIRHITCAKNREARAPRGFTLIELLVVIGIIAVLIGILIPALRKARGQARMLVELSASRQLMQAYLMYTADNRGYLIPGHINATLSLVDDQGKLLSPPEVSKRWPWRLAAHIKYAGRLNGTLLVNERAEGLADRTIPLWSYMVSLTPSFGLNFLNLGGDMTSGGANNAPGCLTKITQASQTSRRIVFTTARFPGEAGPVEGYFKIVPPTTPFEYSAAGWTTQEYQEKGEPAAWGYVHPRFNSRAIAACLDGHSELLTLRELRDMTRWSERAAQSGDPNWKAPASTP